MNTMHLSNLIFNLLHFYSAGMRRCSSLEQLVRPQPVKIEPLLSTGDLMAHRGKEREREGEREHVSV